MIFFKQIGDKKFVAFYLHVCIKCNLAAGNNQPFKISADIHTSGCHNNALCDRSRENIPIGLIGVIGVIDQVDIGCRLVNYVPGISRILVFCDLLLQRTAVNQFIK